MWRISFALFILYYHEVLAFPTFASKHCASRHISCASNVHKSVHNHTISHVAATTVLLVKSLHTTIPSTKTLTEAEELGTGISESLSVSSATTGPVVALSSITSMIPLPSSPVSSFGSSTYSTFPVMSELSNSKATPYIRSVTTGLLITIAIAGSVAVNVIFLSFYLLIRRYRLGKKKRSEIELPAGEKTVHGTANKERQLMKHGTDRHGTQDSQDIFPAAPGVPSVTYQTPSGQHHTLPFSFSSLLSSASSSSLESPRSHGYDAPRRFTTFGLGIPVHHSRSVTLGESVKSSGIRSPDGRNAVLSRGIEQVNPMHTIPPTLQRFGPETLMDPRSPRRHSIPMFVENRASLSGKNHLPPEAQSKVMTVTRRECQAVCTSGLLQCAEFQARSVERESGRTSTSMLSLPSVSSDMTTPRRHWTFVDIHGPSSAMDALADSPVIPAYLSDDSPGAIHGSDTTKAR